jgi:ectoine hydroxylase-related dioxygenase (phytanoyl-CoA dioxygenase family)
MVAAHPHVPAQSGRSHEPYRVTVEEYVRFQKQGFLVVPGLVARQEVEELAAHTDAILSGHVRVPGLNSPGPDAPAEERHTFWERLHMPHRVLEIHERFLLHPRVIDVLEALIGPDVLSLQTMLFFKQPGQAGQGFHQDAYYIPSQPDTLCGAWLAIDRAVEENGCLWFALGSQAEPVYPDDDGTTRNGNRTLGDITPIIGASNPDPDKNTLSRIAQKYEWVKVEAEPGDVVFFGGHVIHWSHANRSDRTRRSFVGHYCNARARIAWNHGIPYQDDDKGAAANHLHILARGTTHLPYAQPKFGTPCAANRPDLYGERVFVGKSKSMMSDNGFMIVTPHLKDVDED